MKFEEFGIDSQILKSIQKSGFKRPTDIQYKSIPPTLAGEDVLAIAQTGTGKTAAFAIPVLHILQKNKITKRSDGIKCVVMVPTHELAVQIRDVFIELGKHTSLSVLAIFGGVDQDPQIASLKKGVDILVATPGRLFDLVSQGFLHLNRIEMLILDEADHMLDLGFIRDIEQLIHHLPRKRQTLFFSATINPKIKKLAYSLVHNPIRIQISPKDPVARNVDHAVMNVEMDDKRFFLERFTNEHPDKKILVFVRTKVRAERVKTAMDRVEIESLTIHGDKGQKERFSSLKQFKDNKVKMLIATDVSARGIDIPNVDFVINYDLPEQAENYVHRVGRTGRGTHRGQAISFCSAEEKSLLTDIEEFLDQNIPLLHMHKSEYSETIEFTKDTSNDWKKLLEEDEAWEKKRKKKKKKH